MATAAAVRPPGRPGPLDRMLRLFSEVRAGEGGTVVLMFFNLLTLLLGYYVIKTLRDTVIVARLGAQVKAYSSAGQAIVLMGFIPLYSWVASRVDRIKLIFALTLFFIVTLELFVLGFATGVPYIEVAFFIWCGVFNNAAVAQFWSLANDVYRKEAGERLFPIIAIGATLGSPLGSWLARGLFGAGLSAVRILQAPVAMLVIQLLLYFVINRRESRLPEEASKAQEPLRVGGGFGLVFSSGYLRLIAVLIVLLNIVNTNGNFILDSSLEKATAGPGIAKEAVLGTAYGNFYLYQNVLGVVLQALLVSRIVKYFGLLGVLLASPLVSFGFDGLVATGVGLSAVLWGKIAENAADYSVMNTGRQMVWLPTRREEKYKAKQAVDTFFVRAGDVLSGLLVFVLSAHLGFGLRGFALLNLVVILAWVGVVLLLSRRYRDLAGARAGGAGG
ncbi:MAG TPA: Npt1/Npt2 family nucleotide transporter [Vicinamibacteria bacterium]|nr:Npt1/Npt2 family nucleotide transporter [Vicinamibacteria bacterium]